MNFSFEENEFENEGIGERWYLANYKESKDRPAFTEYRKARKEYIEKLDDYAKDLFDSGDLDTDELQYARKSLYTFLSLYGKEYLWGV